jgi:hypothetical protein
MIFEALRHQCANHAEFVDRQLAMGLDAVVDLGAWGWGRPAFQADLPGIPVETGEGVEVRHWRETPQDSPYEVLCKEVSTPGGALTAKVNLTPDWAHLREVPLFDDWLVPRSREFLVKTRADLRTLRHVLTPPSPGARELAAQVATEARAFADERGVLLQAGWGVGLEAGVWLCGLERLVWAAIDEPGFVDEFVDMLHEWNVSRMRPVLEAGVDLFVRRGWYEGTAFWSPEQFRRFVLPSLRAEADLAHAAGARFAYIHTVATMPVLRDLMEVGVDVLIGVDPVQGHETNLAAIREATRGRLCLWGGVNGFVTVETGTEEDVRREVREALRLLGPSGLILSPVDNVKDPSERVGENVEALVDEWQRLV